MSCKCFSLTEITRKVGLTDLDDCGFRWPWLWLQPSCIYTFTLFKRKKLSVFNPPVIWCPVYLSWIRLCKTSSLLITFSLSYLYTHVLFTSSNHSSSQFFCFNSNRKACPHLVLIFPAVSNVDVLNLRSHTSLSLLRGSFSCSLHKQCCSWLPREE